MLRLTLLSAGPSEAALRLEGRIVGEWAALLEQECGRLLRETQRVVLDLEGVTYIDAQGAEVLSALPAERVQRRNQSPLLHQLAQDRRLK